VYLFDRLVEGAAEGICIDKKQIIINKLTIYLYLYTNNAMKDNITSDNSIKECRP